MKILYSESRPIKIKSPPVVREVKVILPAQCMYINTDSKKGRIQGIVYGDNCRPLEGVQIIISAYEYTECCVTDCRGIFKSNLSFKNKCCNICISKKGYIPVYLKNCPIRRTKVKLVLRSI